MEQLIGVRARDHVGDTRRRCTATNREGQQCSNYPIPGGFVCTLHGGKLPLTIAAAKERLAILVEPALEVLYRATRNAPPCTTCGRSDADRDPVALRAAQIILDRAGHGMHATVTIETNSEATYTRFMTTEELTTVNNILQQAKQRMKDAQRPISQDGVLLEDDHE